MNVTRKWQRVFAVGCSHGSLIDERAHKATLRAIKTWRPHVVLHLGDWADTTAFRGGARDTADEGVPVWPDIDAGLQYLEEIGADYACIGNHEDRIWRLVSSPNALLRECALRTIMAIRDRLGKLRCKLVPWDIDRGWVSLGGVLWGHGYFYGEQYLRDHAESFGSCVVAHAHRAGVAAGRRRDGARCYGVGTLCNRENMDYAKARRARLAWGAGFVWGEVSGDRSALWLHDNGQSEDWRLPW